MLIRIRPSQYLNNRIEQDRRRHLVAQPTFPEAGGQADIMEHGRRVRLRIEGQPPMKSIGWRPPLILKFPCDFKVLGGRHVRGAKVVAV